MGKTNSKASLERVGVEPQLYSSNCLEYVVVSKYTTLPVFELGEM